LCSIDRPGSVPLLSADWLRGGLSLGACISREQYSEKPAILSEPGVRRFAASEALEQCT